MAGTAQARQRAATPPRAPVAAAATPAAASASATSYERLSDIVQEAPIGIGIVDLAGRTILTNNALRHMLGYSEAEFAAVHFAEFTHPEDLTENLRLFAQLASGATDHFEMDKRFFARDGGVGAAHRLAHPRRRRRSRVGHRHAREHHERRRLEAQLSLAEATYRLLVEQVPAVVYMAPYGDPAPWIYVSPQIVEMLGFTPAEWLADPAIWLRQMHPDDHELVQTPLIPTGPSSTTHYRMRRRDGIEICVRDEHAVVHDDVHGEVVRGVLLDVTREKRLEASLEQQAYHDELIESVAERIVASLRAGDTPGRLGGDEFAILLESLDHRVDAIDVAERVQRAIARPHVLTTERVVTSASIGIAYLDDVDSTEAALRNADLAMYRAKELGKARVATYEPVLHHQAVRRMDIRSALDGALGRRS